MQLNAFTDYALRALVYVAARNGTRCTADEIAGAFGISRHHVVKVVSQLGRLGYLDTVRGRHGGLALAKPAHRIVVGEVIRRTEATLALVECFDPAANTCPLTPACGLKRALGEGLDAFFSVLDGYSLADLIAEPRWHARVIRLIPQTKRSGASTAARERSHI